MKRLITSISLMISIFVFPLLVSAQQTKLTESQKEAVKKEVLPVVFKQIKEKSGIDILGWGQPKMSTDFISKSFLFNAESPLRADNPTPYMMRPDSVVMNPALIEGIPPAISGMLGNIKIAFAKYDTTTIPIIGSMLLGRDIQIAMPETITVSSEKMGELAQLIIKTTATDGGIPVTSEITISLMGADPQQLLSLSISQNETTYAIEAKATVQEGLSALLTLIGNMGATVPSIAAGTEFLLSADISGMMMGGGVKCSLYTILPSTTAQIPMGDANIVLDFSNTKMPIKYIDETSYYNGVANEWERLTFSLVQEDAQNLVLTISDSSYVSADRVNPKAEEVTVITMTNNTMLKSFNFTSISGLVNDMLAGVVSNLETRTDVAPYVMTIQSGETMAALETDAVITVTPSISATAATANIHLQTYEEGKIDTDLNITAAASLTSQVITVDFTPVAAASPMAKMFVTSNMLQVATDNEQVAISNLKIVPIDGSIFVSGCEKATFSIYNINGSMISNGIVSGDNAYISTESLSKGLYIIVVSEKGNTHKMKFIR